LAKESTSRLLLQSTHDTGHPFDFTALFTLALEPCAGIQITVRWARSDQLSPSRQPAIKFQIRAMCMLLAVAASRPLIKVSGTLKQSVIVVGGRAFCRQTW